jgi:hypothetical protein
MKSIQTKLKVNDAIITIADKGNSFVILQTNNTTQKYKTLLTKTNFSLPQKTHKTLSEPNQKDHKPQHNSHPEGFKMEVCKSESIGPHDKRSYKTSQTGPAHLLRC